MNKPSKETKSLFHQKILLLFFWISNSQGTFYIWNGSLYLYKQGYSKIKNCKYVCQGQIKLMYKLYSNKLDGCLNFLECYIEIPC